MKKVYETTREFEDAITSDAGWQSHRLRTSTNFFSHLRGSALLGS